MPKTYTCELCGREIVLSDGELCDCGGCGGVPHPPKWGIVNIRSLDERGATETDVLGCTDCIQGIMVANQLAQSLADLFNPLAHAREAKRHARNSLN